MAELKASKDTISYHVEENTTLKKDCKHLSCKEKEYIKQVNELKSTLDAANNQLNQANKRVFDAENAMRTIHESQQENV